MKTTTNPTNSQRIMPPRAVLSRELSELQVGETLYVPFKYCSANNVGATVTILRKNGLDFKYDNSGTVHSVITRTA